MNSELHRHLDGEIPAGALDPEGRDEADEWERMIASFRTSAPDGGAPPWLEQRVMSEIEALPDPGRLRSLAAWLVRPAPVRISPLAAAFAVAALALVVVLPGRFRGPAVVTEPDGGGAPESVVYVQFTLEAPGATSVAVAGDFNEWQPALALEDVDGDGVWSGRVPVRPGVHAYMFLIDETQWRTDPNAERYRDDGFGNRNAVLAVEASS